MSIENYFSIGTLVKLRSAFCNETFMVVDNKILGFVAVLDNKTSQINYVRVDDIMKV